MRHSPAAPLSCVCLLNLLQAPPTGAYLGIRNVSRTPPAGRAAAGAIQAGVLGVDPGLSGRITRLVLLHLYPLLLHPFLLLLPTVTLDQQEKAGCDEMGRRLDLFCFFCFFFKVDLEEARLGLCAVKSVDSSV